MARKLILSIIPLLLAIPASAGLISFSLDSSVIQTPPGGIDDPTCNFPSYGTQSCVIFTGSFSFTTDQFYTVSDLDLSLNPCGSDDVCWNDGYFQDNVAGLYGASPANAGYSGGLFEVDVDPGTPAGTYSGTATLEATDSNNNAITAVQSFQVVVVPEPAMGLLMFAGLASLAALGRRRLRTH